MAITQEKELDHLVLNNKHIALLRQMRSEWVYVESGAPQVGLLPYDATETYQASEAKIVQKVKEVLNSNSMSSLEAVKLYREAMQALPIFVRYGELKPDSYTYESPLIEKELKDQPFIEQGLAEVKGSTITVKITRELIELLKGANIRVYDDGGVEANSGIDPKRPYGDMTHFYIDMGTILNIVPKGSFRKDYPELREFTEEQIKSFDRLHYESQPVLQVFLQKATIELGTFERKPEGYGVWERIH